MIYDLKKTRKELGLSINDVSNKLKIQKRYLEAIEGRNYTQLPCRVYAVGFIRNYANFLKIDPTEMIAEFDDVITNGQRSQMPLFNENGENLKYSHFALKSIHNAFLLSCGFSFFQNFHHRLWKAKCLYSTGDVRKLAGIAFQYLNDKSEAILLLLILVILAGILMVV